MVAEHDSRPPARGHGRHGSPSARGRAVRRRLPSRISAFVLPLGYSFNLDGTLMYRTFASIFIAGARGASQSIRASRETTRRFGRP
jgi:Sodium:dicarboxylate symporter family